MNLKINIPKNIDFLLIVRGLAAISVIYWHLGGYVDRDEYFASFFYYSWQVGSLDIFYDERIFDRIWIDLW
jgi:uncharacterized membrane protein YcfT